MKNKLNIRSFVLGIATTLLISTLAFTALAATNMIEIKPVRIMVNGEMFVPKDVNGKEVPVFTYGGTTYAPLRALAEAYGLEVGYDAVNKIATVGETGSVPTTPDKTTDYADWTAEEEKAYQEFKAMWNVELRFSGYDAVAQKEGDSYNLVYLNDGTKAGLDEQFKSANDRGFPKRMGEELRKGNKWTTLWFYFESAKISTNLVKWYDCH